MQLTEFNTNQEEYNTFGYTAYTTDPPPGGDGGDQNLPEDPDDDDGVRPGGDTLPDGD